MKTTLPTLLICILFIVSSCNSDDDISTPDPVVDTTCNGLEIIFTKGESLAAMARGGIEPYTYLWSSGETTSRITPTADGFHSCTITDAEGCAGEFTVDFEVVEDVIDEDECELSLTITEEPAGVLTATPINATGNVSYQWSLGGLTNTKTVNENGRYRATVIDEAGCEATEEILVDLAGPCEGLTANFEFCDQPNVLTDPIIEGGTPPYQIDPGFLSSITVGEYIEYTITDATGCIFNLGKLVSEEFGLCQTFPISISHTLDTNVYTASTNSDNTPESYHWTTGDTTESTEITESGMYSVVIEDVNGCISATTFEVK